MIFCSRFLSVGEAEGELFALAPRLRKGFPGIRDLRCSLGTGWVNMNVARRFGPSPQLFEDAILCLLYNVLSSDYTQSTHFVPALLNAS